MAPKEKNSITAQTRFTWTVRPKDPGASVHSTVKTGIIGT